MTLSRAIALREQAYRALRIAIGRGYGVAKARLAFQRATHAVLRAERKARAA